MSIFWRDCPHCGAGQPASALHCDCGYCFEPEQLEGTIEALELQAHEEQLYYEYLRARLSQARAANHEVRGRGPANPTDRYFDALTAEAAELLRAAEAELASQSRRVVEARERVERARASGASSIRDRQPAPAGQAAGAADGSARSRALQSRKAAVAVENRRTVEIAKCPRCTAALPPGSGRCGLCGCLLADPGFVPLGMLGVTRAGRRPRRRPTG